MATAVAPRSAPSLTEGPIAKTLFFFSLPMLLGNVLQTLNGTVNSIWVGKFLGEAALTAASNGNIILFFLISSIFGVTMAATILIGQSIGAKDIGRAKRVVGTSAVFFLLLSLAVGAAGILFSPYILTALNTPVESLEMAIIYTRIIFAGIPFMFGYNYIMTVMRGSGDSKTPFYFLILCVVLDIALNPVFIFGFGPVPELGIGGSALATVMAQFISFICIMFYLYRTKYFLRITSEELHLLRMDLDIIWTLIRKGVPMGLQMIVVTSSAIALMHLVNSFGIEAAAAYTAANNLSSYVQMPAMALGAAVSSFASQNIGAGRWDRVHRTTWIGVLFNLLMTGSLVVLIHVFNREALLLFLPSTGQALEIGMRINEITLWSFVLFGIMNVITGVVRSTGAVIVPLLITILALWGIRIPLAYIFVNDFGLNAVWWSFPTGFAVAMTAGIVYYVSGKWKNASMEKQSKLAEK
ncbi:MATE family efflux transporter [Paenibacillus sp. P96]|uniref:MATE family efflux transporter n=1 Tax=Paenibacillus zeirhizosphaerae TaxID=2987519 RepID=A0ABT9FSN0_9BACL|nr:MATE family efflux transporter [Paenibacillus sp. P96]MDP4097746.1 MATE family efflux transporter [Paenibacillus sp. P96]